MTEIFIVTGFIIIWAIEILVGCMFILGLIAMCIYSWHHHDVWSAFHFYGKVYRKLDERNKIKLLDEMRDVIRKYNMMLKQSLSK